MDLCDSKTVHKILAENGFAFSKKLGQNFIVNPTVCPKMAAALGADLQTGVLEIGPGIGTLTKELCRHAGKVVAIEKDERLPAVLNETLGGVQNLKVICADFLKINLPELICMEFQGMSRIMVCANLPYYITTPILTALFRCGVLFDGIVLMMQKEMAERITAEIPGKGSSAITVMVHYYASAELLFPVNRGSFMPPPQVDSAVVRLTPHRGSTVPVQDETAFFRVVNAAFSQRRKTLLNSLSGMLGLSKETVSAVLFELHISPNARPEELTLGEFALLSERLTPPADTAIL